jgi:hypothetical protein
MSKILILVIGIFVFSLANAQDNDFFTDPSLMKPWDQGTYELGYTHPDILKLAQRYDSVMVDQPEILIAVDSKYRGAKGDDLKQLADVARLATIERLAAGGWTVTDEPGPNVVYLHWAISDLYLKKKKRSILSYTPVGLVVHTTAQAAMRDLWKKIDIVELSLMIEWLDSSSGEVLSAGISREGARKSKGNKEELVSWEDLDALFQTIGEQTLCHMDNNKLPEGKKRQDCDSILIEPAG